MSTYQKRMAELTGGNLASTAKLNALFGPEGVGSGSGTTRQVESNPALDFQPGLN